MRRLMWLPLLVLLASSAANSITPVAAPTDGAEQSPAERVLAAMTLEQQVGQLFMVGTPSEHAASSTQAAIRRFHVGNAILMDTSYDGRASVQRTTRALQRNVGVRSTHGVRLLVAADQEGGNVQHLRGPGFSTMPTAVRQGRMSAAALRSTSTRWGRELRAAGVNLDLAPVTDTVPAALGRANQPIGHWERQLGSTPARVATRATAIVQGMRAAHVATSAKHFPGLGRVRDNTDFSGDVVDRTTRRGDAYLRPFAATVAAGVPMVMMSTALYPRIDAHVPACFSRTVIGSLLRKDLGFRGVVVSDSLDTPAVARWSPGQRAVRFLRAGGDMILVASAAPVRAMAGALLADARSNPAFRAIVQRSALRVLRMKQAQGLL